MATETKITASLAGPRSKLIDRLQSEPTVGDLSPVIERLKSGPCDIVLNAQAVTHLDPLPLQALAVIHKTQSERGHRFDLRDVSQDMRDDLALYGFDRFFFPEDPQ